MNVLYIILASITEFLLTKTYFNILWVQSLKSIKQTWSSVLLTIHDSHWHPSRETQEDPGKLGLLCRTIASHSCFVLLICLLICFTSKAVSLQAADTPVYVSSSICILEECKYVPQITSFFFLKLKSVHFNSIDMKSGKKYLCSSTFFTDFQIIWIAVWQ